jgi:hypothetical protein
MTEDCFVTKNIIAVKDDLLKHLLLFWKSVTDPQVSVPYVLNHLRSSIC